MCAFDWYQNHLPWMTLNGPYAYACLVTYASRRDTMHITSRLQCVLLSVLFSVVLLAVCLCLFIVYSVFCLSLAVTS